MFVDFYYFIENCFEIRGDGKLNEYDCSYFLFGCLRDEYNSSEIYKCMYFFNIFILLLDYFIVNLIYFFLKLFVKV